MTTTRTTNGRLARRLAWAAAAAMFGLPALAHAVAVNVVGLFPGKAIVIVDGGKPRTLAVGDAVGGVKLISATSDQAVFDIDGKRRTLGMGQAANVAGASSNRPTVTLMADGAGHYVTQGSINGMPVRLIVDTGATMVSMGMSDAKRLGLQYAKGERGLSTTANGTVAVYKIKLDTVKVGGIVMNQVDGLVQESDMPFVLLGMSFLNRLELKQDGPQLTMVQRF